MTKWHNSLSLRFAPELEKDYLASSSRRRIVPLAISALLCSFGILAFTEVLVAVTGDWSLPFWYVRVGGRCCVAFVHVPVAVYCASIFRKHRRDPEYYPPYTEAICTFQLAGTLVLSPLISPWVASNIFDSSQEHAAQLDDAWMWPMDALRAGAVLLMFSFGYGYELRSFYYAFTLAVGLVVVAAVLISTWSDRINPYAELMVLYCICASAVVQMLSLRRSERAGREMWLQQRQIASLVGLTMTCNAMVDADGAITGDAEFVMLFGQHRSFRGLCTNEDDVRRADSFINHIKQFSVGQKIRIHLSGVDTRDRTDVLIHGVKDGASVRLGMLVLDNQGTDEDGQIVHPQVTTVDPAMERSVDRQTSEGGPGDRAGTPTMPMGVDAETFVVDFVTIRINQTEVVTAIEEFDSHSSSEPSLQSVRLTGSVCSPKGSVAREPGMIDVQISKQDLLSFMKDVAPEALTWAAFSIEKSELVREGDAAIIGTGGYGTVYKDKYRSSFVAVKDIKGEHNRMQIMQRELCHHMRMRHRNIVMIVGAAFGVHCDPDGVTLSIVMELCEGGTVYSRIFKEKDMTDAAGLVILTQVAEALAFLHHARLLHNDVKAGNVLLATRSLEDPLAKLADFGFSSPSSDVGASRKSGEPRAQCLVQGTPGFIAPEKYKGSNDCAVDVYAFGFLGYEIFAWKHPMDEVHELVKQMAGWQPGRDQKLFRREIMMRLSALGWKPDAAGLDPRMAELLNACWNLNPDQRPTMRDLVLDLRSLVDQQQLRSLVDLVESAPFGNVGQPPPFLAAMRKW